jgi:hypothetical protein
MKEKRLERFLSAVLFFALLPGMVMAQKPDGDPQSGISGSSITLKLELPSYEIMQDEEGFHVIQVEGFSPFGLPGDPWLPRKVYNVAVPPDAALGSLTLEVVDVQVVRLPGPYRLKPASPDIISEDSEGDAGVHQSSDAPASDTVPANFVRLLSPGQMRKWRFARLEFTPFQVDAATGELSVASELTVQINYDVSPAAKDEALLKDRVMDGVAQQLLINYNAAQAWYQVTSGRENLTPDISRDQRERRSKDWQQQVDQSITHKQSRDEPGVVYDYVIITTNAIEAGSSKLANFIAHKQGQGHSVLTITEDEYGGLVGQSPNGTAEKIRKWLQDDYIAYGIEYVLLIGDPDPDDPSDGGDSVGDVPMKMCWPRRGEVSDEEAPTDYFFADLTGNWDLDGDQYYGEWSDDTGTGGVDFANELYVGRIPVYAAGYTTLDNILQKIMDYANEANPESWRKSTLLPMSFSNATYDGAPLAEQMMDDYVTAAGFSSWTQYQQGNGACGLDSIYPSDRWAANDYGLVLWWAHGSATSAAVGYGPSCRDGDLFLSGDASSLDDDHPSFTYQCSCLNGYPENTNNLQYAILKQGGIGTVSATRVSWFNTGVGYGDFDGSTTNSGIGYEYASRLVGGQPASNALYNAKASMTPEFATRLMNFYDFNLYGDPSTGLYTASAGDIKVAIYDHATTSDISYWTGGNWNSWSQYQTVLQNDPEGRFDVSIVTDLSAATLADFSRLILPDNAVPDAYLSDVAAWFTPGRRIIAADSATCYAAYSGFMWPASAGSNGYDTYWDYYSSTDDQEVLLAHKITEDYSVGDILSSISSDAQMFSGMLPTDAEQITAKALGVAASGNRSQTNPQVNLSPSEDGGKVAPPGPAAGTVLPVGPEVNLSPSEDGGQVTLSGPAVGTVGPADSAGSTWVVVSPNPLAVSRPAGTIPDNGYFYLIGGESSGGYLGKVQRYDPGSDTWDDTLATMPTPGSNLCAAAIGDDIYVPGGYNGLSIADLQVYHTNSDTWATITTDPLPSARTAPACAAYNGKLYVVGGNDAGTSYNNTWVYDPASPAGSRWTGLANAPAAGSYGGALAVGHQIFWAGMRDTNPDLASVYAYDPAGNVWTTYPSLQTARGAAGLWAIGDLLLVGGGGWGSYLTSVEQYDTSLGTGGTWSSFGADLAQGRRTFGWATSASGDRLFAAAGWAGAYLAEAETLDAVRMIYVASRDVPGHGTIIVLGPYQTSPGTDVEELIRDAVEGPGVSNTPPTLSGLPDAIIDHTTGLPVQIDLWAYASDAETPDSGLTYTIEGSPPPGAGVTIAGNRWLTVNPSASWCGWTDVTVRVTDPGGLWDNDTFRVAVSWSCQG